VTPYVGWLAGIGEGENVAGGSEDEEVSTRTIPLHFGLSGPVFRKVRVKLDSAKPAEKVCCSSREDLKPTREKMSMSPDWYPSEP